MFRTSLHEAAERGDIRQVRRLVEDGAGLGEGNQEGWSPLICAVWGNHGEVAAYLAGVMTPKELAVTDNEGKTVLHYMAWSNRPGGRVIQDVCSKCPVLLNMKGQDRLRPVDVARNMGNRDIVSILEKCEEEQQQRFAKGIAENMEKICNVTITFIGHEASGKTTLKLELLEEEIPAGGPGSTDTADFFTNHLVFNPSTGFRQVLGEGGDLETGRRRLRRIIDRYSNAETLPSSESTDAAGLDRTTVEASEASDELPLSMEHLFLSNTQRRAVEEVMASQAVDDADADVKGFVTFYDFGGEKVFYNTCHSFMSSNMVFILVFDVAMCLDPSRTNAGYDRIETWLRSVATYAKDLTERHSGAPPIIMVGSHMDLVPGNQEEKAEKLGTVLETLYQKPEIKDIMENHVQEIFPIAHMDDSTKNRDVYEQIWKTIATAAPLQSGWMKHVPARWIALEHELIRLKTDGKVVLTYPELLELNKSLVAPLEDSDIPDFLTYNQTSKVRTVRQKLGKRGDAKKKRKTSSSFTKS